MNGTITAPKSHFRQYRRTARVCEPPTPRIKKYLLTWRQIFKKCGWAARPENELRALRHEVVEDLFGEYIEPKFLTNIAWDVIYTAQEMLLKYGEIVWSKTVAKAAVEEGTCRRLRWCIRNAGVDRLACFAPGASDEYIQAVANDKFQGTPWEQLDSWKLEQLLYTIKARVRAANLKGQNLWRKESEPEDDYPF